tara:strand:- start:3595 stop:3888 length:294 start_codon:yes stop_codon:yes gene_type:complete
MATPQVLDKKQISLGWVEVGKKDKTDKLVDDDDDDDDLEILAMWERGEHTCEKYDAFCAVCDCEQEEGDIKLLTELLEGDMTEDDIQRVVSEVVVDE